MAANILVFPSANRNSLTTQSQRPPQKSYRKLARALLADFVNSLRVRRLSEHTIRAYTFVVKSFLDSLLSGAFLKNEQATVSAYIDLLMTRGLSRRTVNTHISILREFFRHLKKNGIIDRHPILEMPMRRGYHPRLPKFLTEEEMARLLDSKKLEVRERALLEFLYGTGARVGECSALRIEHLNFQECVVLLRGKGRKEREVPLGRKAAAALKEYLQGRTAGPVFPQKRFPEKAISTRSLARFVSLACLRAGLGHHHPHEFRHSYATHLLNSGVDLLFIQTLLGHAWVTTTARYTSVALSEVKKTYDRCHPRA